MQRYISMDVCDYTNTPLCNLYDSTQDLSGQATDVFVNTERNGYKDLTFKLPSVCSTEEGEEKNYRLNYLISDYRIRLRTTKRNNVAGAITETTEIDWFLISESRVQHSYFSTDYEIQAKHISQLLNTKNLDLEFSDDEGNNTGTIGQIAQTILEGTGWHLGNVYRFMEEDKYLKTGEPVEKVRSFTAAAKTGAFKMISDLCTLFDAKPLYHGEGTYTGYTIKGTSPDHTAHAVYGEHYGEYETDKYLTMAADAGWTELIVEVELDPVVGRTVDLIPMNPFSEDLSEGNVPEEVLNMEVPVLELHYDKNVKNITRTLNTENLVTKLTAYGSYGDRSGMASLQKAEHTEISFATLAAGEYEFVHNNAHYYFTLTRSESGLKWSDLDFVSRAYVYNNSRYYKVYKQPQGVYTTITGTNTYVKNELPFVMDFSYYDKIGLLTEDMFAALVNFQKTMPQNHITAEEASIALINARAELTRTASDGEGFAKLDIRSASIDSNGNLRLRLNKTTYPDGVIYRSDYDEARRNYFTWSTAVGMKNNGEAINGKGSVVYIFNQSNSAKYVKGYIRALGNATDNYYRDSLGNIYQLHTTLSYPAYENFPQTGSENIIYYAEDTKKMYTWTGSYVEIQASNYTYGLNEFPEPEYITLWTSGTWSSSDSVYLFSSDSIAGIFGPREDSITSNAKAIQESTKITTETHPMTFVYDSEATPDYTPCIANYGWYYRIYSDVFSFGDLYFCNSSNGWQKVNVSTSITAPVTVNEPYFYSLKSMILYKAVSGVYTPINETTDDKRLLEAFAVVIAGCINQEILYKGYKEEYYFNGTYDKPAGNYAFRNEFGNYWLFTTTKDIILANQDQIRYKSAERIIWQDDDANHIIKPVEYSFRSLNFAQPNDLVGVTYTTGSYANGAFSPEGNKHISSNIPVFEQTKYVYTLPSNSKIVCLTESNRVIGEYTSSPFITPLNTTHIRLVCDTEPTNSHTLHVDNYQNYCFANNKPYCVLSWASSGKRLGMAYLINQFVELADDAYNVKLPALKAAQQTIKDANIDLANTLGDMYREGFWQKNDYVEGDENKLYIDALDNLKEISHPEATYELDFLDLYGADDNLGDEVKTDWVDIEITYAAHLIDTDIDTNKWAYIDKVNKCYDQNWKTKIEINTRLSMIGQQSFTDVLSRIAEVAEEVKAKQTIYKRADALTGSGKLAAERLEGAIQANKLYILGGTSNWYTDTKGNIIFEAADGESAMMLSGRGWAIADTKDQFGDWDFRYIATGKGLTADAIYTGYLSAERIEAGSITTDKLSASVGQELEISSNKSLALFATTDGTRPAGSLLTQHPGQNDSWIEISAKNGNDPAHVAIKSGGQINIEGTSEINIGTDGELNVSGGDINITSNGTLNVDAMDQIVIGNQDLGVIFDNEANIITQTVSARVGKTYVQLTQPVVNGLDVMRNETIAQLNKGDTWIKTDSQAEKVADIWNKYINDSTEWNKIDDGLWADLNISKPIYVYNGSSWIRTSPDDRIIEAYTRITQTEDAITLEAVRATTSEGELKSSIDVQAGQIVSQVQRIDGIQNNVSVIQQTADDILLGVSPVGAVQTQGSYINIADDEIRLATGGKIIASADQIQIGTGETLQSALDSKGDVTNSVQEYYVSTSSQSATGGSWSTNTPQWTSGKYVWSRTKVTHADQSVTYMPSEAGVCIQGAKGESGAPGADGKSIGRIETRYKLGTSYTVEPTGAWNTWSTTMPAYEAGKYYWTWTKTYLTDNAEINPPGVKLSELGVNAAYDKAADAKSIADNIISGSQKAFYSKNISNTGITVDNTTLHVTSQGNMYIDSGGALLVRNSASTAQNPQNVVVMNNTGIALQTTGKLTAGANQIELTSGGTTFQLGDKLNSLIGDATYYGIPYAMNSNGNAITPKHGDTWIQGDRDYAAIDRTWQLVKDRQQTWAEAYHNGVILWGTLRGWIRSFTYDSGASKWVLTYNQSRINTLASQIEQTQNSITLAVAGIRQDYLAKSYVGIQDNSVILSSLRFDSLGEHSSGIYIQPSQIDINSTGALNIKNGGDLIVESGGSIDISSGGNITINSGGSFVLTSANFSITANGTITSKAGTIGGWTIGTSSLYNGTTSMVSANKGVYLGTDGIRLVGDTVNGVVNVFHVASSGQVIFKSGMSSLDDTTHTSGMYLSSTDGIAFGGGNFKVTNSGAITAKSGKIATWNIGTTSLYNGTTSMSSTTQGIYISTNGIRMFYDTSHIFHVPSADGNFVIKAGMTSLDDTTNTSGTYLGYNGIALGGGKFKVTNGGSLTATDGVVGGWNISSGTPKRLYSGSGTGYVALDSNNTLTNPNLAHNATTNDWVQPYAIWCGSGTAGSAPFRVRRDGVVVIKKLLIEDPDNPGTTKQIDLYTNFNSATSVRLVSSWSGNSCTINAYRGTSGTTSLANTIVSYAIQRLTIGYASGKDAYVTVRIQHNDGSYSESSNMRIDASAVYDQGANSVDFSDTGSWSNGSRTITLTNGKPTTVAMPISADWNFGDNTITVTAGGRTYAHSVDSKYYNKGWNDCLANCTLAGSANAWYKGSVSNVMIQGVGPVNVVSPYYTQTVDTYTLPAAK